MSYVGLTIGTDGVVADYEKISAIMDFPTPNDKPSVMRLLGMANYLAKFIPSLSDITAPRRKILKKNVLFHWDPEQQAALSILKKILTTTPVLALLDVNKSIELDVDSSQYGIGCILMQDNRPVAYASCALTPTQCRYAQIEKQSLAVLVGCTKFHHFCTEQKM